MTEIFYLIEITNREGNTEAYFEDPDIDEELDTYWTKDINKAMKFSSDNEAQNMLDNSTDVVLGNWNKYCKVQKVKLAT